MSAVEARPGADRGKLRDVESIWTRQQVFRGLTPKSSIRMTSQDAYVLGRVKDSGLTH